MIVDGSDFSRIESVKFESIISIKIFIIKGSWQTNAYNFYYLIVL